jgi:hypothetical protein
VPEFSVADFFYRLKLMKWNILLEKRMDNGTGACFFLGDGEFCVFDDSVDADVKEQIHGAGVLDVWKRRT